MSVVPELLRVGQEYSNGVSLLPEVLSRRDEAQRFTPVEKALLAQTMACQWPSEARVPRVGVEWVNMDNGGNFRWGTYPDGERFVHNRDNNMINRSSNGLLYVIANLETLDDVNAVRTAWSESGEMGGRIILGTTYFPNARGDRRVKINENWRELVLLKPVLTDLFRDGVRGLVLVDSHSPALPWYALRSGIGVLDLSAIPLLMVKANNERIFDKGDWRVVVGDDGARELGMLVSELAQLPPHIQGRKSKHVVNGKWITQVTFSSKSLKSMQGKSVIMPEDIISTGGTMEAVITDLHQAGVNEVVILATYPIFAEGALGRLGSRDGVTIITTDGRSSIEDTSQANNIIKVPVKHLIPEVLKIDQSGINFWTEEGRQALADMALCHSPWQVYNHIT